MPPQPPTIQVLGETADDELGFDGSVVDLESEPFSPRFGRHSAQPPRLMVPATPLPAAKMTLEMLREGVAEICKGADGLYDTARITSTHGHAQALRGDGGLDLAATVAATVAGRHISMSSIPQKSPRDVFRPVSEAEDLAAWGPTDAVGKLINDGSSGVAILTSGGDAPGMNAAVRSCVAVCVAKQTKVFAVTNGYKGLVVGGRMIKEVGWRMISDIMSEGGTVIGSARCPEMRTREGRLAAACNLANLGINRLVVIGGDGSLTGAEVFKTEWPGLLEELVAAGRLSQGQADQLGGLCVVGMVGSIDNDMCGFSSTIGADTALHRIVDACDSLITTAKSHRRTFIVEVMGRNCGHLALMAAVAVGADWVFIPEVPPQCEDWERELCETLENRQRHSKYAIVIVAEGATDRVRRPIESEYLKSILTQRLGHDTRVTCLGHVQRGGMPSAYDRIQGTRVGAEAAFAILAADDTTPSRVVGFRCRNVIQLGLTATVNITQALGKALDERRFEEALEMRSSTFKQVLELYESVREWKPQKEASGKRICILHAGSPAAGNNAVAKVVVRKLINRGYQVYGAKEGFLGLSQGLVEEMAWEDVAMWSGRGGCDLGTNRVLPDQLKCGDGIRTIAATLTRLDIDALVIIGGFDAYYGLLQLFTAREEHEALRIPMACVPVTISNNIPGTDISVGCDTALNSIVEAVDRLKLSAASSRARLFLVEVMGSKCGFLAVMGALAGGADNAYIHENLVSVEEMQGDIQYLRRKFEADFKKGLIIRNERCSKMYDMDFMQAAFEQEGTRRDEISYTVRNLILGHLQQGNQPTPLDRVRAARLAGGACNYAIKLLESGGSAGSFNGKESACVVGLHEAHVEATPVIDLVAETDFVNRRPKHQWFVYLQDLIKLLEMNSSGEWGADLSYTPMSTVVPDDQILQGTDDRPDSAC